jgi:hypothetical protein
MSLTNEEIKKILDGAPDGSTTYDDDGYYSRPDVTEWLLSDLAEILALRERVERLEREVGNHFKYGYGFCRANGFLFHEQLESAAKEYVRRTTTKGEHQ